jgi:hypothetical protein
MTVTELLAEMRAAHACRTQYQRAADRLFRQARELARQGWEDWALETGRLAVMVRSDARGEYERAQR